MWCGAKLGRGQRTATADLSNLLASLPLQREGAAADSQQALQRQRAELLDLQVRHLESAWSFPNRPPIKRSAFSSRAPETRFGYLEPTVATGGNLMSTRPCTTHS